MKCPVCKSELPEGMKEHGMDNCIMYLQDTIAELLEALNTIHSTLDMCGHGNSRGQLLNQIHYAKSRAKEAIRQVEEQSH